MMSIFRRKYLQLGRNRKKRKASIQKLPMFKDKMQD
jgi:hypothetical protein